MRLLLAEDDLMLGKALETGLKQAEFNVEWVQDGESTLLALEANDYTLVILDVNLPKLTGLQVLKRLREMTKHTPVLIMTARDGVDDRVEGLNLGADDYLVKPFELKELVARVRAIIRRSLGRSEARIVCGDVELDINARLVKKQGELVKLAAKEYKVLLLLMEHAGKLLSKSEIEESIYDVSDAVESNTVETAIYALRKKLGKELITTIRGVGYMANP
ncbi:MAG: DNA-binding response regulator [Proteobacteria bacterium]|nr:DNA-binding response regulator [Pseudomonadota bacterium]